MSTKMGVYLYVAFVLFSFPIFGFAFNLMNNGSTEAVVLSGTLIAFSTLFLLIVSGWRTVVNILNS